MQNEIFNYNNVKKVLESIDVARLNAKNALENGSILLEETLGLSLESSYMAIAGENAKRIQKSWENLSAKFEEFNQTMESMVLKAQEVGRNNQGLENTTNIEILEV